MSFEQWAAAQLPPLLRFATALCGGPDPAEEIVQEVLIKVYRDWPRIRDVAHPQAYLRRMIVNHFVSWRRKWARVVPQADPAERRSSGPDFSDQHADREQLIAELAKLPRKQRAVLVLRYLEGLGDDQIAGLLHCSPGTVRSHASRGLATLRIEIQTSRTEPKEDSRAH